MQPVCGLLSTSNFLARKLLVEVDSHGPQKVDSVDSDTPFLQCVAPKRDTRTKERELNDHGGHSKSIRSLKRWTFLQWECDNCRLERY